MLRSFRTNFARKQQPPGGKRLHGRLLQGLCRFSGGFFDLLRQEGLLALGALEFAFVGHHQQNAAFGARRGDGTLPRGKIASRVVGAAEEDAAFARLPLDKIAGRP